MKKPRIVAALICGNEEERIERCVKSLQPLCADVVVVRAVGALKPDKTLDIAKSLGCYTDEYHNEPLTAGWPHLDNFAAARNKAFRIAYDLADKDGWVMWADCDDILPPDQVDKHLAAVRDCPADCDWILTDYVIAEQHKRAPRERLFRYHTGWWWRAVHENVHPTKEVKIHLRRDLEIHHAPPPGQRPSNDRNMRILRWQDQFSQHWKFYLHYEKMISGDLDAARRYGAEALALRDLDGVHKYETLLNMSNMTSGETAMRFARAAKELDPHRREAFALEASVLLDEGRAEESLAVLDQMDKIGKPAFPQWTHRAEYYGWKATKLRAWALRMSGKAKEAHELEMDALKQAQPPVISLLHATRGRPIAAVQAMSLWLSRADRPERVEHIFAVDADDETAALLQRFGGVCQNKNGYSVGAWNLAAQHSTGDILLQLSDDWEPPPGWDSMIDKKLDITQHQVLRVRDGYRTDELMCMAIVTRGYYEQHGLFDPRYRNVYSDADFTARAIKNGAVVDSDIVIVHHHPIWEKREFDETYKRCNDAAEYERAKALYMEDHG